MEDERKKEAQLYLELLAVAYSDGLADWRHVEHGRKLNEQFFAGEEAAWAWVFEALEKQPA